GIASYSCRLTVAASIAGRDRTSAELVECFLEFRRDIDSFAMLDVAALHHVDELSFSKQTNRRRGRGISCEIRTGSLGRFAVLTGKDSNGVGRLAGVLHRQADRGTHAPGRAAANRIHH